MEEEFTYDNQGNSYIVTDYKDDYEGGKLGFWVFLLTEVMMFGVLFLLFAIFFYRYGGSFVASSKDLNVWMGGTNTVILLISTYTMGLSTFMMRKGNIKASKSLILITMIMAVIFLGIKAMEWSVDIQHGIYLGSDILNAKDKGEILFFGLYFVMTGLHGLHIIVGISLMLWVLLLIRSGVIHPEHTIAIKNVTLYWDFVHLIWIVLFPLFYMIGV